MVRNNRDTSDTFTWFDRSDRQLISLQEAAEIAGVDTHSFLCGVQAGHYPPPASQFSYNQRLGVSEKMPRWRRGAVAAARDKLARTGEALRRRPRTS